MPINNAQAIAALTKGLKLAFDKAYKEFEAGVNYTKIATVISSDTDTEEYPWLGNAPGVREWIGERQEGMLKEFSYSIKNKTWENTIAVKRTALEDRKFGQIKIRINDLASNAAKYKDKLTFTALVTGLGTTEAAKCYDNQYFFDTDHPAGDGATQSNKVTTALSATALQAGITAMALFADDRGEAMGFVPDMLVVPPALQWIAMELLESTMWPEVSGTAGTVKLANNVLKGKLELVVTPYVGSATSSTNWFLLCTKGVMKPIIFQDRTPIEFAAMEANSEAGFMRDEYTYGTRARYNVGYGLWQTAYGSTGAGG